MPSPARVSDLAGKVRLAVEVHGVGDVTLAVPVERPAVDNANAHSAPRSATASGRTRWSGKRLPSAAAHASGSCAHTRTVGPDPERVAPAAPDGRSERMSSRSADGR